MVVLIYHRAPKSGGDGSPGAGERRATVSAFIFARHPARPAATLALLLDVPEDTDVYMPMVGTRIAH